MTISDTYHGIVIDVLDRLRHALHQVPYEIILLSQDTVSRLFVWVFATNAVVVLDSMRIAKY